MTTPSHLSVTQIRTYLRCPAQYYFRYVRKIMVPPPGSLVLGRAVHASLEYFFWQKLFIGTTAPLMDVLDVFSDTFDKERPEAQWDEDPGKAKDDGASLIRLYYEEAAPHIVPAAVEMRFEVPVAGITLLGFVDLIAASGVIIDHKVVSRTPSRAAADEDLQLTAYTLAYRHLYGEMPREVQLNFMVRNKTPKLVSRAAKRSERDLNRFTRLVEGVAEAIRAGVYYPNPDNFMCSPAGCGYWEICHRKF